MSRRPAGPVRQHSLQQPPRRQQQIRRQRSTEDEKNMQIYSNNAAASRNRFTGANNKCDHQHHHLSMLERPKVRVAWGDQPVKPKNDGVEIVARQITPGKSSRPTTGRGSRAMMGRCPLAEKATILYSRQELAERLRLAWRQREENKSNIDIFLAHNTVEERCDSRLSTATSRTIATPKTPRVQSKLNDPGGCKMPEKTEKSEENAEEKTVETKVKEAGKLEGHRFQSWFSSFEQTESTISVTLDEDLSPDDSNEKEPEDKENNEEAASEEESEAKPAIEKKSSISINCNDWNASITINNKSEIINEMIPPPIIPPDFTQAKLKRAGYQSGQNKAFVGPVLDKPSTPPVPRIGSRINSLQEAVRRPFRRTSSAPPQRRTQVNIVIETPGMTSPTTTTTAEGESERRPTSVNEPALKSSITPNRPIKSAPPVKRRSKSNKRRGPSMACAGKDEVEGGKLKGAKSRSAVDAKSNDVVTMVSLVSSADSESEMDENSPRDDKLICELRNKLPTTPIIKSSNSLAAGCRKPFKSVSFQQDSFDYDSPPLGPTPRRIETSTTTIATSSSSTREESAARSFSLQARFVALSRASSVSSSPENTPLLAAAAAAAAMTVCATSPCPLPPTLQLHQPATRSPLLFCHEPAASSVDAPLTDREKRCLAVPIGDIYDKKRKLVRCKSAAAATRSTDAEKQSQTDTSRTNLRAEVRVSPVAAQSSVSPQENHPLKVVTNPIMPTANADVAKEKSSPAEPYCQTPKEKECWHLYRKMCDKGVFVSFDTVLRGMLTPTEYRLRQKEMSQNC